MDKIRVMCKRFFKTPVREGTGAVGRVGDGGNFCGVQWR